MSLFCVQCFLFIYQFDIKCSFIFYSLQKQTFSSSNLKFVARGCAPDTCADGNIDIPGIGSAYQHCCDGNKCNGSDVRQGSVAATMMLVLLAVGFNL